MMNRLERLRLVVMESPYDCWDNPLVEPLYAKMVGLKLRGYGRVFPYGVLAADTTDLISDHLLLCEETPQGLVPLFGNKSVPLNKCEIHHLPFPGISVPEESGAHEHVEAVKHIIANAKKLGHDLRYAGSMTIDPKESGNKEWSKILRELFTTIYFNYYQSLKNAEILAGATIRFKVDSYTDWLGHKRLELNGKTLGPVHVAHLANEPVVWTHLTEFSFEARRTAKKWESMWLNRIHIPATSSQSKNLKKAA
jgi:hypothetical protein